MTRLPPARPADVSLERSSRVVDLQALQTAIAEAKVTIKRLKIAIMVLLVAIAACVGWWLSRSPSGSLSGTPGGTPGGTPDSALTSAITQPSGLGTGITIVFAVLSVLLLVFIILYARSIRLHDRLLEGLRGENGRLAREVRQSEELLRRAESSSTANYNAVGRAKKELEKNVLALQARERELSASNKFLESAKLKEGELTGGLMSALEKHRNVREELAKALGEIEPLKGLLTAKAGKIKTLEDEVKEVILSRGSKVASAVTEADEQIKRLSEALRRADKKEGADKQALLAANEKLLKTANELNGLKVQNEELLTQQSGSAELTAKQKAQLTRNQNRIVSLEKTVEVVKDAADQARARETAAKANVEKIGNAARVAKAARDASQAKASALETNLRLLGKQLADADEKAKGFAVEADGLGRERDKLKQAIASREAIIEQNIGYAKAMENTVEALRTQLAAAKEKVVSANQTRKRKREGEEAGDKRQRVE